MKPMDKKLLQLFHNLSEADRHSLIRFAQFLAAQDAPSAQAAHPVAPLDIERPPNESVVAAIRRLSASYHMLEKSKILDKTSVLMTQHVMGGRDKNDVIEEMERLFAEHYQVYLNKE